MPQAAQPAEKTSRGLRYWMEQVVAEAEKARDGFKADPVHDLRVAIRRCRSIAEGFVAIDPEPTWKLMRRAAKPVFAVLGDLRDVQVQMEWVEKLGAEDDPVPAKLMDHFQTREHELKALAADELAKFDTAQWLQWAAVLDERAQQLPPGGEVFQVMALERLRDARALHATAMRSRSKNALHALRIGIKKFRYIVENFLPEQHEKWQKDLKRLQDALGDVHDLDVLWDTARVLHVFGNPDQRQHWAAAIGRERTKRIEIYRAKMIGKNSLWQKWRAGLPQGEALHAAVLKYFQTWAFFRDPDLSHTDRVLRMSMAIYNHLSTDGFVPNRAFNKVPLRDLLTVAVLAHEVGRNQKAKHHKAARRLLEKLDPPPGWTPTHLQVAGLIARYHRGRLPADSQRTYAALNLTAKSVVNLLGGVIRLADAFDRKHDGTIERITLSKRNGALHIEALGFQPQSPDGERVASARYLLESVIGLPIFVRGEGQPC